MIRSAEEKRAPVPCIVHHYIGPMSFPGVEPVRDVLPLLHPASANFRTPMLVDQKHLDEGMAYMRVPFGDPGRPDLGGDPFLLDDDRIEYILGSFPSHSSCGNPADGHPDSLRSAGTHHGKTGRDAEEVSSPVCQRPFQSSGRADSGGGQGVGPAWPTPESRSAARLSF